jgi:hypothetical protein
MARMCSAVVYDCLAYRPGATLKATGGQSQLVTGEGAKTLTRLPPDSCLARATRPLVLRAAHAPSRLPAALSLLGRMKSRNP